MQQVIVSQYTVLLDQLLEAYPEGVEIQLLTQDQLNGLRAGLSRAKKQYSIVQKFIGEKDLLKGKGFNFTPKEDDETIYTITIVAKQAVSFVILSAKPDSNQRV